MYGQGPNGQQHHPPAALPPFTSSQPPAASNSAMHRPPAAVPSQINQLHVPRGPPYNPPFQGPSSGMTNATNPSHASLPHPPPVPGRMPISGNYLNSQHNPHHPLNVGTQNSHHFPSPSPHHPPPPAGPSKQESLPPLVQGHKTYWYPVNSQPRQPGPPIPNPNSGLVALAPAEIHTPPLAPPPPPPPRPQPQPPLPPASSSPVPPSPPQRNDKVGTSEVRAAESLGKGYGLDRSTALEIDIRPAPPKPADEKIVKRIETLCQFIAKNGSGFEDMARTRESANPEFKFLFGGEPGSDAAVAHEYYQWAKKKYTFGDKLHEGSLNVRPSEADSSVQSKPFTMTSVAHPDSDSDMEMEDDITQVDMDQEMKRPVEYYRQDSDLVHDAHDGKELAMPQIVQCASAQDISSNKVPSCEASGRSDYGHQGSGIPPNHEWLLPGSPSDRICSDSNMPQPAGDGIAKKSTTVPADVSSPPISSPAVKSGRPRLVQDYTSDDSSENSDVPHSKEEHTMVKLPVAPGYMNKSDYTECRSESDLRAANTGKMEQVVGPLSDAGKSFVAPTRASNEETRIMETVATSSEIGLSDKLSDTNSDDLGTIHNAASSEAFARNNNLRSLSTGSHENGKSEKETGGEKVRSNSTAVQVDEFGRLVRKGASDSDSDDSSYAGRRHKKRERSRSRSQSPVGRRSRRRRSLQRTRDRRNRSRSWSPRGRRSRSRSPVMRHVKEYGNDVMRRNKSRMPECFDFLRGRCYRGASCRYWHQEAEMDRSKRQRRRGQTPEMPLRSYRTDSVEEMENLSAKVPYSGDSEVKNKPWRIHKNVPDGISDAVKHEKRDDSLGHASRAYVFGRDGLAGEDEPKNEKKVDMHLPYKQLVSEDDTSARIPCTKEFEEGVGTHQPVSVDRFIEQPLGGVDSLKSCTDDAFKSARRNLSAVSSQSSPSRGGPQNANYLPQLDNSSQSLPDKKTMIISASESLPDIPHHSLQLPQHISPFMQGAVTGNLQQMSGDHVLRQSPYASQGLPSSMLSGNQQNLVSAPQNSNWSSMPPSQPFPHVQYDSAVKGGAVAPALYTEFQQSHVSHTNFSSQILKPYPTGVPAHSHVGELPPGAYSTEPVPGQSLKPREDYRSSTYAAGNIPSPQVAGLASAGPAHPNEPQCYPSGSVPPPEVLKFSSQVHPYMQQQNPTPALQDSGSAFASSGGPSSSTFLPDGLGGKQTNVIDFAGLRSSFHNPFASTFEQPLISKFGSGAFGQDYHSRYNTAFPFSHASVDGIGIGSVGSRQTTSSPKSATLMDRALPRVGGDQYDPLFDSIEPSSSSVKKVDRAHKGESVDDSDVILRTSDSNTPVDVEENNKRKEIGAFAPSMSVDDDGFGETAEVEVGAVENASVSNAIDAADATEVEMEIDQIKSPGKSKKRKDSRSMKLFKVALADFVKEVLRPSWRQGNMSKEAFKTIVKKTVDKVTGAMKSHHIPKSQVKINHYIDSSQRKLTKLVMGYVDKYVNV
ncbi:serine/arginine repetitive matrix protein 2 isoform X2 [Eucalyptus grandis]|uniref:serine/arginine repetitive matrix protein 2 isoform X2 n=1 Tax=Eucalyptus grandis TaxID=71139 RepID=UPI00192EAA99|nr:serine/arginine repetitive matrix protein 2 isoform X2 [Eucalyptus grandis]